MENKAVFLECTGETKISKKTTPGFWLLYQQSVLLSIKDQGFINEIQYERCLEELTGRSGGRAESGIGGEDR